jgi:hypothetical protein
MANLSAGAVIDRLKQALEISTDIALGEHFGHATSTVSGWRSREKVPYEECVILAKRKGISLDWLLLGLGEQQGETTYRGSEDATSDRTARLVAFLHHFTTTHRSDEEVWLEMQIARAVPEYAEWVAQRAKG